jgi:hypothetical protein
VHLIVVGVEHIGPWAFEFFFSSSNLISHRLSCRFFKVALVCFIDQVPGYLVVSGRYELLSLHFIINVGGSLARVNSGDEWFVQRASRSKRITFNPEILVAFQTELHIVLNRYF